MLLATHQSAGLDLLMLQGARRAVVELEHADSPQVTRSMSIAGDDLQLDALYVVYSGDKRFRLAPGIEAVPLWAALGAGAMG